MSIRLTKAAVLLACLGLFAACGDDPAEGVPPGTGGTAGGGGTGGGGGGPATDPPVIDPVVPDSETDVSDSGYEWEDTDGDGVPDSPATSAETTSLPDTGSPFAAALTWLFAALVAVRLALAVRARRTGA